MFKRLVIVGAVAACVVPVTAGPASATSTHRVWLGGISRGYGSFTSGIDEWQACDTYSDGEGIQVDWSVKETGRTEYLVDSSGNDGVCAVRNTDIHDGYTVFYRVCLTIDGNIGECSPWWQDQA